MRCQHKVPCSFPSIQAAGYARPVFLHRTVTILYIDQSLDLSPRTNRRCGQSVISYINFHFGAVAISSTPNAASAAITNIARACRHRLSRVHPYRAGIQWPSLTVLHLPTYIHTNTGLRGLAPRTGFPLIACMHACACRTPPPSTPDGRRDGSPKVLAGGSTWLNPDE